MFKKVKATALLADSMAAFIVGSTSLITIAVVGTVSSNYAPETKGDWMKAIENVSHACTGRINRNKEKLRAL